MTAGSGSVYLTWAPPDSGHELALFQGTQRGNVFLQAPILENLAGPGASVGGLTDGVPVFFGIGVRRSGEAEYVQAGLVMSALPGPPVYVDAASTAVSPDGSSIASAFPTITAGALAAFAQGGGNVWVRSGSYAESGIPLFANVRLQGGFGTGFDPATRDPVAAPTIITGGVGPISMVVQGGEPAAAIDGLDFRGGATGSIAIDLVDTSLELRSTHVSGFTDRGIRLRNDGTDVVDVRLAHTTVRESGADGLSASGAFELRIDGCSFDNNAQEGLEVDDLVALEGTRSLLEVRGSRFFGNGAEGLDVDLAAPLAAGPGGGQFVVRIRGSRFDRNATDGLLVDFDFEAAAGWSADVAIEGSGATGNGAAGLHVDLDAAGSVFLHRLNSTANGGDGVLISSETVAGAVTLSTSVLAGNLGAGARASTGLQAVAASHCIFAGNAAGGLLSEVVSSSATSCIAYLQDTPWGNTTVIDSPAVSDPADSPFEVAPELYGRVLSVAMDELTVESAGAITAGSKVEVRDDGTAYTVTAINGNTIVIDQPVPPVGTPAPFTAFASGIGVEEDYRVVPGSDAIGAGMSFPGATLNDAGVWGSPAAGEPGRADERDTALFWMTGTTPSWPLLPNASDPVEVHFSAPLEPSSVVLGTVYVETLTGVEVPVTFLPVADRVVISPLSGNWGTEMLLVQIHRGLQGTSEEILAAPVVLPLTPQ